MKRTTLEIFKKAQEFSSDFTDEEVGKVCRAVFAYAQKKELPQNLPRDLNMCFLVFKDMIDKNEERYQKNLEYNKKFKERRMGGKFI